jgi:hypothetical protein
MLAAAQDDVESVRTFRNDEIQGVQVASVIANMRPSTVVMFTVFGLVREGSFRMYQLSCGISPSFSDVDISRFEGVAQSLDFERVDQ